MVKLLGRPDVGQERIDFLAQHVGLVADEHEMPGVREIDDPDGALRAAQLRGPSIDERLPCAAILVDRRPLLRR